MKDRYPELDNSLKSYFTGDFDVATEALDLLDEMTPAQVDAFIEQARAAAADPAPDDEVDRFVDDAVMWEFGNGRETLLALVQAVEAARSID
ncbi:MAG: hypothetical protein ACXIVQ_14765 [Acidimicrobiales bacterium]